MTARPPTAPVTAEARLRPRYQLTLPEAVAAALSAAPDDCLVFQADPAEPGVVRVRKARTSWATEG